MEKGKLKKPGMSGSGSYRSWLLDFVEAWIHVFLSVVIFNSTQVATVLIRCFIDSSLCHVLWGLSILWRLFLVRSYQLLCPTQRVFPDRFSSLRVRKLLSSFSYRCAHTVLLILSCTRIGRWLQAVLTFYANILFQTRQLSFSLTVSVPNILLLTESRLWSVRFHVFSVWFLSLAVSSLRLRFFTVLPRSL